MWACRWTIRGRKRRDQRAERLRRYRIGHPMGSAEIGAALDGKAKHRRPVVLVSIGGIPGRGNRAVNAANPQRPGKARDIDLGTPDRVREAGCRSTCSTSRSRRGGRESDTGAASARSISPATLSAPGLSRKRGDRRRRPVIMRRDVVQRCASRTARRCPATSDSSSASRLRRLTGRPDVRSAARACRNARSWQRRKIQSGQHRCWGNVSASAL